MNNNVARAAKALNNGGTHSVQYNVCEVAEPTTPIVDVLNVSNTLSPLHILKWAKPMIGLLFAATSVSTLNEP